MGFFQICSGVIKKGLGIQELFSFGRFEKNLNASFVSVISKKCGASEANEYQPISLVNGVQKIISKVLANCLGEVVGKIIISALQTAFVCGQQILDPIIIANEYLDNKLKFSILEILCKLWRRPMIMSIGTSYYTYSRDAGLVRIGVRGSNVYLNGKILCFD